MSCSYYLFEDQKVENFLPLVWLHPFVELRLGISTIFDKWVLSLGFVNGLYVRSFLKEYTSLIFPKIQINSVSTSKNIIFLNARLNPYHDSIKEIVKVPLGGGFLDKEGNVLSFCLSFKEGDKLSADFNELLSGVKAWNRFEGVELISGLQDLIGLNGRFIIDDFTKLYPDYSVRIPQDIRIIGDTVVIHDDADISPYVVIDATQGPVVVDKNAKVCPFVYIQGPAFIGEGSIVKPFAKILENSVIGPVCKIGGEVEASIIQSYSNKQHDGFLGHSFVGSWVNLGADTVTSDLKNNYSNIRLKYCQKEWDSDSMFIGTFFGDHVKTGINTMLNSGTIIGVFTNVFGEGFPPKFIPSFMWGGHEGKNVYEVERALETAERMMARRNVALQDQYRSLIFKVFELSEVERKCFSE
ncbi:MAG TPA: putative sugar nucleotidyl transferase [Candidatus Hydrothermia bacterium]|nr:putative sugar nucleotidyl transferase [Candidatus Hydrothermia bacterium]HOL23768.1 putative sugar nucleotidyl transferase [Candidatus Hydrothermia bacterium]HPO78773.1 putative sugar nucleotidyl transferase [Candidatus Hydrothermia bacterium]